MPKYLVEVKYTLDGIKGVKAEGGSARVAAASAAIQEQGGKVEAFYFAFGENDAYVVADMPDNVSAAALGLIVSGAGGATTRTVVLLTADEMDAASKRKTLYRPPGG
jgi:uncharacterized protein with GYD domain